MVEKWGTSMLDQAGAVLFRDFRDLFRLTLGEVEAVGISRSTWARIERGRKASRRRGVARRVEAIRRLMECLGRMPYRAARAWALHPLTDRGKSPRDLIMTNSHGINEILRHVAGQQDVVTS
jgi:transcriptional regulator with XRE-family HTH domain